MSNSALSSVVSKSTVLFLNYSSKLVAKLIKIFDTLRYDSHIIVLPFLWAVKKMPMVDSSKYFDVDAPY